MVIAAMLTATALAGCNNSTATPQPARTAEVYHFPERPAVTPPAFKVAHQDNDTYTLVTKADATDDEMEAIVWALRDAARGHGLDALHLSQKFVDARKPTVWFHVYRGAKCASEKYTKGPLPCEAAYHGAGDYTLGSYTNAAWDSGVLNHADGSMTQLWDSDTGSR